MTAVNIEPAIRTALLDFGLSEPEARVYRTMLELGPQPASIIARKAGLKRGHTYNMLASLVQKGVAQEFIKDTVKFFIGSAPTLLLSLLEQREEELEKRKRSIIEIIPRLEQIRNPHIVPPKVRFYQGVEGIKEIYKDTLRMRAQPLFAIGDFDHYFPREKNKELNDWMWEYCRRRAKNGTWYIGIVNKSTTSDIAFKRRRSERRKLKMLKGVRLSVEVNIYGNRVAIISSSEDMVGLIIEDEPTATTLRNFHQAMWKLLPDYKI